MMPMMISHSVTLLYGRKYHQSFKNDAGEDQTEVQKSIFSESFDHLGVRVYNGETTQINANWVEGSTVLR